MVFRNSPAGRPNRFARGLLVVLLGIGVVELLVSAIVYRASGPDRMIPQGVVSRGIWSCYGLIRPPDPTSTDIMPSIEAASKLLRGEIDLYRDFDLVGSSFIYPPTTAVELLPLGWVAERFGIERAVQAMDVFGRLSTVILLGVALGFVRRTGSKVKPSSDRWAWGLQAWGLALMVGLAFFPMRWSIFCVQAQTLINAGLAVAILAYGRKRCVLSGVLLGLVGCLKPHFALIVGFAALRKEWRLAASATATGLFLITASLVMSGIEPWQDYVTRIAPSVAEGYADASNQSFTGLMRRWSGDAYTFALTPASPSVRWVTRSLAALMIGVAFWRRSWGTTPCDEPPSGDEPPSSKLPPSDAHDRRFMLRALDMSVALLALTLASPVAWNHHYGWTLAMYAICVWAAWRVRVSHRVWLLLALSYVLASTSWFPVGRGHPGLVSLLDSKLLYGAVVLLWLAWHLGDRLARADCKPTPK